MATVAGEVYALNDVPIQADGPIPVIIDGGEAVRIALVRFPAGPEVGTRFAFDGGAFEIVRAKDHARGFVAHPLAQPAS